MRLGLGTSLVKGASIASLDADAKSYINAVQAADGLPLESWLKTAINDFVKGCKSDASPNAGVSNWDAIKSSNFLAGPRTLSGALIPLKGVAPTNNNFVGLGTDYTRLNGLTGNGTTKYLNSNRTNDADPQNNNHNSVYLTNIVTGVTAAYIGAGGTGNGANTISQNNAAGIYRNRNATALSLTANHTNGFLCCSRNLSTSYDYVNVNKSIATRVDTSQAPNNNQLFIFGRSGPTLEIPTQSSIGFYSIGEAVNIASLQSRVNAYFASLAANLSAPVTPTSAFIVGSSTAVGVGATSGNSWASKFTTYYTTGSTFNRAISGSAISNSAPTGYTIPTGWTDTPDPLRNVTYAIQNNAKIVLINFPSNFIFQTNGTTSNYMSVLDAIIDQCTLYGVDYRIFTTQPRTNATSAGKQILKDTADAIISTYGSKVVNTFSELADPSTLNIKSTYDAGDGVHINNAGHQYLYDSLIATL
jgi:hypothetical protein